MLICKQATCPRETGLNFIEDQQYLFVHPPSVAEPVRSQPGAELPPALQRFNEDSAHNVRCDPLVRQCSKILIENISQFTSACGCPDRRGNGR